MMVSTYNIKNLSSRKSMSMDTSNKLFNEKKNITFNLIVDSGLNFVRAFYKICSFLGLAC